MLNNHWSLDYIHEKLDGLHTWEAGPADYKFADAFIHADKSFCHTLNRSLDTRADLQLSETDTGDQMPLI